MADLPTAPVTVKRLSVEGFKRLSVAEVTPTATGLVPVRGRNEQGKSSLIESMIAALRGREGAQDLPIHNGDHGAEVVVDLGEIVVKRVWTRDSAGKAKTKLSITTAEGSTIKSPQGILDALSGEFADPVAFLAQSGPEQARTALGVLGLSAKIDSIDREAEALFERRRDLGRDADRATKAAASMQAELKDVPPAAAGSFDELTAKLQADTEQNTRMTAIATTRDAAHVEGNRIAGDILAIEARIAAEQQKLARLKGEMSEARNAWQQANASIAGQATIDLQPTRDAIAQHNASAAFEGKRALLVEANETAVTATATHAAVDDALKAKRAEMTALMASAQFPMEGVTYDPAAKVLCINGIPLAQASQAERIKFAAAIAMAGEPIIRVIFIREGSLLDDESQALLGKIASDAGWQVWIEVVDSNPEGPGIYIEDGQVYEAAEG